MIVPKRVVLGGIPALDDIVGRTTETSAVLASFSGHGALLTGDRRFGKTSLTRLVEVSAGRAGHNVVRISAERGSCTDFVQALADALAASDSAVKREVDRWQVKELSAGPLTVARAGSPRSLDTLVRAAVQAHSKTLLVLIVDEIPVLAKAMERREPGSGGDLLHLLRRLRQDHTGRLVMVLSGSIGFHHVARDALGAVNDVAKVAVGPLRETDAIYLARCLLLGESVATVDDRAVGAAIAAAAERVPYYIHHLVRSARDLAGRRTGALTPADIPGLVDAALADRDDPWDLRHYRERVRSYFGDDQEDLIAEILDGYAASPAGLTIDEVKRRVDASDALAARPGRSVLLDLIERLEADHYLVAAGSRSRFASEIVRRAWIAHQRR